MKSITIKSPAKVNLFLKVLKRRRDGYHEIVTLFHRISLYDTLTLTKANSLSITSNVKKLPTGPGNIVWHAYELIKKKYPRLGGVKVRIRKRIPIGAGLGGGSSNAAHFLTALCRLYNLRPSPNVLKSIGKALGADVGFFLSRAGQALGYGLGDEITPLASKRVRWFVLVTMPKPLLTKHVYQKCRPRSKNPAFLTKQNRVARLTRLAFQEGHSKHLSFFMENDLEAPCIALYPAVRPILRFFDQIKVPAMVSGSGATSFALVDSRKQALETARLLRRHIRTHSHIFVCRSA